MALAKMDLFLFMYVITLPDTKLRNENAKYDLPVSGSP